MDYLWVYILGGLAIVSLLFFLLTFSRDMYLTKRLRLKKSSLVVNFSLLLVSLASVGLVIYLFTLLKNQINLLG